MELQECLEEEMIILAALADTKGTPIVNVENYLSEQPLVKAA
jgi:hypothetical protein